MLTVGPLEFLVVLLEQMDNKFILNQKYAKRGTIQARIARRKEAAGSA